MCHEAVADQHFPSWCRFLGRRHALQRVLALADVGEAPRHEIAGGWAPAVRLALWGFEAGAGLEPGPERRLRLLNSGTMITAKRGRAGLVRRFRRLRRCFVRGRASRIDAGQRPAHVIAEGGARSHDVSILTTSGVGRCRGSCPRANTSMTSMRPPQHGQGRASARGWSAETGSGSGSTAGGGTASNLRAFARLSARLPLANSP